MTPADTDPTVVVDPEAVVVADPEDVVAFDSEEDDAVAVATAV